MEFKGDDIHIPAQDHYEIETFIDGSIMTIADAIWPGFTPDLLSIALVTATQAKGTVLIHQKMFESRLFFVENIKRRNYREIFYFSDQKIFISFLRKKPNTFLQNGHSKSVCCQRDVGE